MVLLNPEGRTLALLRNAHVRSCGEQQRKYYMAIFHCQAKAISRGSGRSATAAAAYRAGEKIEDYRTGEVHDYRKKHGICYTAILTRTGEEISRSKLWNIAEFTEKRKDAKVAREWEIALPSELTEQQQKELVLSFARSLIDRYGIAADICIHAPGKDGDHRNHHAHILTTTRTFSNGTLGEKTRILDSPKTSGKEVEEMRRVWAELTNQALENAGYSVRIDHRSLSAQGISRTPSVHLGPIATAMERRGIQTERGDLNRATTLGPERTELNALEQIQAGINAARQHARLEWQRMQAAAAEAKRKRQRQEAERERKRLEAEKQQKEAEQQRLEYEKQRFEAKNLFEQYVCGQGHKTAEQQDAQVQRMLDTWEQQTAQNRAAILAETWKRIEQQEQARNVLHQHERDDGPSLKM